jgi:ketosteroid isomerase-like protein
MLTGLTRRPQAVPIPPPPPRTGIEGEVERASKEFYAAFEARDLERLGKVWVQDATVRCIQPNGVLLRGWIEVKRGFELIFDTDRPHKVELTQVSIEVGGSLALVSLVERVAMPQSARPRREHAATSIFRKVGDDWKLICLHVS